MTYYKNLCSSTVFNTSVLWQLTIVLFQILRIICSVIWTSFLHVGFCPRKSFLCGVYIWMKNLVVNKIEFRLQRFLIIFLLIISLHAKYQNPSWIKVLHHLRLLTTIFSHSFVKFYYVNSFIAGWYSCHIVVISVKLLRTYFNRQALTSQVDI